MSRFGNFVSCVVARGLKARATDAQGAYPRATQGHMHARYTHVRGEYEQGNAQHAGTASMCACASAEEWGCVSCPAHATQRHASTSLPTFVDELTFGLDFRAAVL